MSNLEINIESVEPVKKRKGRPIKIFSVEEIKAKEMKQFEIKAAKELTKKKRGIKPKFYTKDEIIDKIEHLKKYQSAYAKNKYVKKIKPISNNINHCLVKKYKIIDSE